MSIGPYKDWDECVADQMKKGYSKEIAEKICGKIEQLTKEREEK
jgi:hypothetical protein